MKLLEFIKDNKNWRDILSSAPYSLLIKEKDNYALFKYNHFESDMSLDIVREARGVIIDLTNMTVACRAFDKFFNATEPYAAKLSDNIIAEEKIDGAIIKVWTDRYGKVRVSTNGNIDAEDAPVVIQTDTIKTYKDLFNEATKEISGFEQFKDYTLIFEMVSPLNRIVVQYPKTELYFLGMRDNSSMKEYLPYIENDFFKQFKKPKIYDIKTVKQAIEVAKTLGKEHEGFVLIDENFNRVKVKGTLYLSMHLIRNNSMSNKVFLETILEEKDDDLISYFPEYKPFIKNLKDKMIDLENKIEQEIKDADFSQERKEFALSIKDFKYKNVLFKIYSDPNFDWKKEVFNVSNINKLLEAFGLKGMGTNDR